MRVLVLYAHPVQRSFCAALHAATVEALKASGHEVDDLDLYAEKFDPVMSEEERKNYHDTTRNRAPVQPYVERLLAAEGLVIVTPVWNFGYPAILKGFLDRVFLPGVSFEMVGDTYRTTLHNIRKLAVVTTYGATPLRAFLAGDPPRRMAKRILRAVIRPGAQVDYVALYNMNGATAEQRRRFLAKAERRLRAF